MGRGSVYARWLGVADMGSGTLSRVVYGFSGYVDFNRGRLAGLYRNNSVSAVGCWKCDVKSVS